MYHCCYHWSFYYDAAKLLEEEKSIIKQATGWLGEAKMIGFCA